MESMKQFMESLHVAFQSPDLLEIPEFFARPVVIYSLVGVRVLRSESELLRSIREYRDALETYDLSSIKLSIVTKEVPMNQRFRVTVRYRALTGNSDDVTSTLIRYFLVAHETTFKIEMVEYMEAPIPRQDNVRVVH